MKKRLISLSLISLASVLAFSGCANSFVASSKTSVNTVEYSNGDHRDLPHYRADELPNDNETYDLTVELTYKDIKPASAEEFEQFLQSVLGPSLVGLAKDTFPELFSYVLKHNVLTQRELYDLSSIAGKIMKATQGQEFDPAELVVEIATKVDLDKFYYLLHQMRVDEKAFTEVKKFIISIANNTFIPMDYRAANKYLKSVDSTDARLAGEAADEELVWGNFKINSDDLEIFEKISDFFANPDIRVFLRFVNLFARTLAKNLTKHELGFVFTNIGLIDDDEYRELCYRYMLNNAASFIKHLGNIMAGINITSKSWMMMLRGLQTFALVTNGGDDNFADGDNFVAVDYLTEKAFQEQVDFVYNAINPAGIKVLFRFIGNLLNALPKDFINSIMINYEDPSQIDYDVFYDIYNMEFAALNGSEKDALLDQAELFGIDLEHLFEDTEEEGEGGEGGEPTPLLPNRDDGDDDEAPEDPFEFLMYVLNKNLFGPFMNFFINGLSFDPVYPEYEEIEEVELDGGEIKLILRQDDEFTESDFITFIYEDWQSYDPLHLSVKFTVKSDYYYETNTYYDRDYRSDFEFEGLIESADEEEEGRFDTSEVGDHYIIFKYHVTLPVKIKVETPVAPDYLEYEIVNFDYDFEWKVFYYVVDKKVDVYTSGFRTELVRWDGTSYPSKDTGVAKDTSGKLVMRDYRGVITMEQSETKYTSDRLAIDSWADCVYMYIEDAKRYINISDEKHYSRAYTCQYLKDLDVSKLGLHYGFFEVEFKKDGVTLSNKVKYVFAYNVVESFEYEQHDGFYDPGFGW